MSDYKIQVGDIVSVTFPTEGWLPKLKVLYVPLQPLDCWHFIDPDTGQVHYIQQFEKISLIQRGKEIE